MTNDKPNIICILADDLGYGDLGCYGQEKTRTLKLDRMAAEGTRFTDHYAAQPTPRAVRAAMITRMDRDIGPFLDLVKGLGLDDRTIVMFTRDNGPCTAGGQDPAFFQSAGPLGPGRLGRAWRPPLGHGLGRAFACQSPWA